MPSLAQNIRQGNSLISGTEEELRPYFGDAWRDKRPFNWEQEFKDIMAVGGFNVVMSWTQSNIFPSPWSGSWLEGRLLSN